MKKKIYIHEFLSRFLKNGVKQSVVLVIRICTNVDKPSPEPSSAWANIDNLMKMFETHGTLSPLEGGMSLQVQVRSQQLPGSTPDIKTEMNPLLNPRAADPEGSLIGIPGSNRGGNNLH